MISLKRLLFKRIMVNNMNRLFIMIAERAPTMIFSLKDSYIRNLNLKQICKQNFCLLLILIRHFLSSTGQKPAGLCHGSVSVLRASIYLSLCTLTFISNMLYSETANPIFIKLNRNYPVMVLFRNV